MNSPARLGNCPRCGKLYLRNQHSMCLDCVQEVDEEFVRCRDYLRDNPGTGMKELSEETGVSVWQIVQFIIEGRLILSNDNPNMHYPCQRCGKAIRAGRLCDSCAKAFEAEAKSLVKKDEKQGSHLRHSYRILDKDK